MRAEDVAGNIRWFLRGGCITARAAPHNISAKNGAAGEGSKGHTQPTPEPEHVDDTIIREWNKAGGVIRIST